MKLHDKILKTLDELGADREAFLRRGLPQYEDATFTVTADTSRSGVTHQLVPAAAAAWSTMKTAAADDDVSLILISGFRSFARQHRLLRRRVEAGESIDKVLTVLAPAGCSQHHTGRALDIGTMGCEPASLAFAETDAFDWLSQHAPAYGFSLSYPPDNPYGYCYEPWHWYLRPSSDDA